MKRTRLFKLAASITLLVLLVSCATTHLPPISSQGQAFEPERDEQRLWERAREEEAKLRENVVIYDDPLLADYLGGVVNRLNPPEMAANSNIRYRVSVIEEPTLNAFAYPHGSLYLHTGLIARMENEDQLATVLGHEMTHVEYRHMVRHQRAMRNKQIGFTIASIAAAVVIAGEEGHEVREGHYGKAARLRVLSDVLVGLGLQLAFIAAVNGYGRDLEQEADDGGFAKLSAAGYDVREAPKVYEALLEDHGEPSKAEAFFFGNHPRLTSRIENANAYIAEHPPAETTRPTGDEAFRMRIRPVIRDDARLNIEMGRLELAEFELEKAIRWLPTDPVAHYYLGMLHLANADNEPDPGRQDELRSDAADSFAEAARLDPDLPGPHRELGLLAYKNGDFPVACEEFGRYIDLAPDAEDVQPIKDYRLELKQSSRCK